MYRYAGGVKSARKWMAVSVALAAAWPLGAEEKWTGFTSGPWQVWTSAGDKAARETMVRLEQLRHAMGQALGVTEPVTLWPVRVLVVKGKQGARAPVLVRDAYVGQLPSEGGIPRAWQREAARILLESNGGRMPAEIETGLLDLMAGLEAQGAKASFGVPPAGERTLDWARLHMVAADPELSGKLRVWLKNLQQGGDALPAYRNAFGMTPEQLEAKAKAYFSAGQFAPAAINGKAIDPRDYEGKLVDPMRAKAALVDLSPSAAGYQAIAGAEGMEGLAWLAAREGKKEEAAKLWKQALEQGSKSAMALLGAGKPKEAIPVNPKWSGPFLQMAEAEEDAVRKAELLKRAASLEPRNANLWRRTAEAQLEAQQFAEASRSWAAAERAAANEKERQLILKARADFQEEVAEREAAERRRIAEEKQKELDRLKAEMEARVREAEVRASARNNGPLEAGKKVEEWWDGEKADGKMAGILEKVDCLAGGAARVWIRPTGGKLTALLIREPGKVVIVGGGDTAFTCGVQKPAKRVNVEYHARIDAKAGSQGDVALMEFQKP